jgi:hypothetical protein
MGLHGGASLASGTTSELSSSERLVGLLGRDATPRAVPDSQRVNIQAGRHQTGARRYRFDHPINPTASATSATVVGRLAETPPRAHRQRARAAAATARNSDSVARAMATLFSALPSRAPRSQIWRSGACARVFAVVSSHDNHAESRRTSSSARAVIPSSETSTRYAASTRSRSVRASLSSRVSRSIAISWAACFSAAAARPRSVSAPLRPLRNGANRPTPPLDQRGAQQPRSFLRPRHSRVGHVRVPHHERTELRPPRRL